MKHIALTVSILLMAAAVSFADSNVFEGKIQGASYVFNKTVQITSANDPKMVLEPDFVLQAKDGKVYFLPNVPRSMKTKAVNSDVKVYGTLERSGAQGNTLFVHHIDVKYGDRYIKLCDWDEKAAESGGR